MFSVTQRIGMVTQPRNGYLKMDSFFIEKSMDSFKLKDIPLNEKSIQGLVVDYMVRFLSGFSKEESFKISLNGARLVLEEKEAYKWLNKIQGLEKSSLYAACKLIGYDVAYRRGPKFFVGTKYIEPSRDLLKNISILIQRTLTFFEIYGPIVKVGFSFEGGYNELISSGDGDYLTEDTLWDLKVSQDDPKKEDTLQLLVYYILGRYSGQEMFQEIQFLGIYNPILNKTYQIEIDWISNRLLLEVTHQVVGYKVPVDYNDWDEAKTVDWLVLKGVEDHLTSMVKSTFNPADFADGIHNISIDDYWYYYGNLVKQWRKPKFSRTKTIKFLKRGNFYMFISLNHNGILCSLNGGSLRKLENDVEYYYLRMEEYGETVLARFKDYWEALKEISRILKQTIPEKNIDLGRIHGSIVDIDYHNHVYLNPMDGSITPYFAISMTNKYVYRNVASLIAAIKPKQVESFIKAITQSEKELMKKELQTYKKNELVLRESKDYLISIYDTRIDLKGTLDTSTSIYRISNQMTELQKILDYGLITRWLSDILPEEEKIEN